VISVLVAPLFYLIPLGFALCLLGRLIGRLSAALLLPSACCIGFAILTILFQVTAAHNLLRAGFSELSYLSLLLAAFGLLSLIRWQPKCEMKIHAVVMALVPVAITYSYTYFVLYRFPNADLFQEVHPMKGAEELGRFGVLSPFVTDSYIPIKQAITGILIRVFGFDQLIGYWLLGAWTIVFKLVVVFAASSVVRRHRDRALVFIFVSALIVNAEFSNGILCFFTSLLLMTAANKWMRRFDGASGSDAWASTAVLLVLVGGELVYVATSTQAAFTYVLIGLALLSNFRSRRIFIKISPPQFAIELRPNSTGLLILLLVGAMLLMHRSSVILIPIALLTGWVLAIEMPRSSQPALKFLAVALPILSLLPLTLVLAEYLNLVNLAQVYEVMLSSFAFLLGSNPDDDFGLGVGLRNALIEWARSIGPMFGILLAITFFYTALTNRGRALSNDQQFTFAWIGGWILTLVILTGAPFGYRASFYASFLFSVAVSIALPPLWQTAGRPLRIALAMILACSVIYLAVAHCIKAYNSYLDFVWPIPTIAAVTALFLLAARSSRLQRSLTPIVLASVITIALSLDRVGSKFILLPHSYGEAPSNAVAISHYTKHDLEVAQALRALDPTTVIVSDPYTMGLVRARTGLDGPISYSNLDTVAKKARELLRAAINGARSTDKDAYCAAVNELLDKGAREYWHSVKQLNDFKGARDKPSQTNTVFVFSDRTAEWATAPLDKRVGYFPSQLRLREDQIAAVAALGSIVSNSDDMTIAALVSCPELPGPANPVQLPP
jgi:hypothetical protein